ncbi:hypothetical protein LAT59_01740 [Candidatus Gracilibacteria bacterium]|nr:hypothetical protein [Candidatus Gracilibacteria bacterium]
MEIIRNDSKLKKFYFFPGLFSMVFLSLILTYQGIYTYVELLGNTDAALEVLLNFFHSGYIVEVLIGLAIVFISYIIILPIFEGALIRYIDQRKDGSASCSESLGVGMFRFYPLFEFNSIVSIFKFISLVNAYLFALRLLGLDFIFSLNVFFMIAFLFSCIINILLAYARFEIVLENKSTFDAIGTSTQISLVHLKTTLKLYFMMFLLNIRVILNFILFILFPLLALSITSYIGSLLFTTILLGILGGVFLFFMLALGYLAGVLEVFTKTMWYKAYKIGKEKLDNINNT